MIPPIRRRLEAIPLRDNIQKHKQTLFNADLAGDVALGVLEQPVGELHKGDLVHVAEVVEAVGDAVEQEARALCTGGRHDGHCIVGRRSTRATRVCVSDGNEGGGRETGASGVCRDESGLCRVQLSYTGNQSSPQGSKQEFRRSKCE
jgi:hypothetical protein